MGRVGMRVGEGGGFGYGGQKEESSIQLKEISVKCVSLNTLYCIRSALF